MNDADLGDEVPGNNTLPSGWDAAIQLYFPSDEQQRVQLLAAEVPGLPGIAVGKFLHRVYDAALAAGVLYDTARRVQEGNAFGEKKE